MSPASTSSFLDALKQSRVLDAAQLAECGKVQAQFPDSRAMARELVKRGWLTTFQVNQLLQGRAAELRIGSYILLERLGEGGMGQVFKARHEKMGRVVALKVIRKERIANANAVKRFHNEVQAASRLSHPNVVLAYDFDEVNGTHFFAMEYVEGHDLLQLVKQRGPLPIRDACEYVRQAALGLQHAHERGLIHRDIKPANLLVANPATPGETGTVKVLDMGLARLRQATEGVAATLTQDGAMMGTPDYVAPEQAVNSRTVDIRADIYSLGCTLYYLLAGQVPFTGETIAEKLLKHQLNEPTPVEKLRPEVPAGLAGIVRKMMAKKPEDRFQTPGETAAALADAIRTGGRASALKKALAKPPAARRNTAAGVSDSTQPLTSPNKLQVFVRKHRWPLLAAAGAVAFLCLLPMSMVVVWLFSGSDGKPVIVTETNSIKMKLVKVPAGKFQMGSPSDELGRSASEGPVHTVAISQPFYLGTHEVTNREYRMFVNATKHRTDAEKDGRGAVRWDPALGPRSPWDPKCNWQNPGWPLEDDGPVVCVSWSDAVAFCNWLARKESKVYRLPTEAEWEYACRAGSTTSFSFGATLAFGQANFNANPGRVVRVGSFDPNNFGLCDMHGNVWEWCSDYFDPTYYISSPASDPQGVSNARERVVRGGSWADPNVQCRSAMRGAGLSDYRDNRAGFRVVWVP